MEKLVWCALSEVRGGAVLERRKGVALELPPRAVLGLGRPFAVQRYDQRDNLRFGVQGFWQRKLLHDGSYKEQNNEDAIGLY